MNNKILSTLFIISSLSCSDEEPIKNLYQEEVINHLLKEELYYDLIDG